jgi:long-subunit fatty acid transport protein
VSFTIMSAPIGARAARRCGAALLTVLALSSADDARAAGGYYSGTKGARAAGRAGAFVAKADDVTAAAVNPAGLAGVGGTVVQVGNRFSYNYFAYDRATTRDYGNVSAGVAPEVSFDTVENEQPFQLLDPLIGAATNFGLRDFGFALYVHAPPGIGRLEFPVDGGQRYMMVSREAIFLSYSASAAYKYRDVFGVGLSLAWIHVPRLKYSLVIDGAPFPGEANPVSSPLDMQATPDGADPFTLNAIIGAWVRPAPFLQVGLSAQVIPSEVVTDSELTVTPLNDVRSEIVLRRNDERANDVTVSLPLPLTFRGGVRYIGLEGTKERYDLELDVEYETWSRVGQFTLETNDLEADLDGQIVPIGRIDIEKHWQDTVAVRLGGDYAVLPDKLTMRGGLAYETATSPAEYYHVDFASGAMFGAALGASMFFGNLELAAAYELRVQPPASVSEAEGRVYQENPASPCEPPYTVDSGCSEYYEGQPAPTVNGGEYWAQSHMLSIDAIYRF